MGQWTGHSNHLCSTTHCPHTIGQGLIATFFYRMQILQLQVRYLYMYSCIYMSMRKPYADKIIKLQHKPKAEMQSFAMPVL